MKVAMVDLPGLAWTTKRLADGTRCRYCYAWRGGPRLFGEPDTPEFVASYHAAHASRKAIPRDTLKAVIVAYRASPDFTARPERTRKDYLRCIHAIEVEFATLPLETLKQPRANALFLEWRDKLKCGPRWQDYHWTVLKIILNWGRDRGLLQWQAPSRSRKLYKCDRSERVWLASDIAAMSKACSPELRWALELALETGQRQGDLLKLTWSQVRDGWLVLRQGKTKARVEIPVTGALAALLARIPKRAVTILTNSRGLPWTEAGFRASWAKAFNNAKIGELHFNDLRGTAVVNLANAGCTVPEIASITGHSLKSVNSILEKYWTRTRTQATNATAKLEAFRAKSGT
jgi:integrase